MKRIWFVLSICMLLITSCHENIDMSARYVFKESTAMDYLKNHPDAYSEYVDLLYKVPVSRVSATTLGQLLSARGHYTVFAPTNEAIHNYLDSLVLDELIPYASWDAFTDSIKLDSIRKVIVYSSIIDTGDFDNPIETGNFPFQDGGEISFPTMNEHKLTVYYRGVDSIQIYNKFNIDINNRDIQVLNGVIHQMHDVIAPKDLTATYFLQQIIDKEIEGYLVMARAIQACDIKDTLNAVKDDTYEMMYQTGQIKDLLNIGDYGVDFSAGYAPPHRKFGYTIFAETDDFWRSEGLDPKDPQLLQKLVQWIIDNHQYSDDDEFITDGDFSNPKHILWQWVTYHILPMKLAADKLVTHYNEVGYNRNSPHNLSIAVYELYTTFGKRRLLKVYQSRESDGIYLNRFPNLDNGRTGTYHELSCDPDKVGSRVGTDDERAVLGDMINCILYPIDAPLSYNDNVRDNLMKQRLRFDAQSIFPETMNNDMRQISSGDAKKTYVYIPSDDIYHYMNDMWLTADTYLCCINYHGGNPSYNADEIKAGGRYDVTIRLPPVPRQGTYEFRFAILNRPYRGVCQIYLGTDRINRTVTGIPIDMTKDLWAFGSGWERETDDQDYNAEVDKRMRTLGYMKGTNSSAPDGNAAQSMRVNTTYSCMRQIVIRKTIDPDLEYYVTFKNVLDYFKELYLDYFEWCAKEVYDNPETPEDIW